MCPTKFGFEVRRPRIYIFCTLRELASDSALAYGKIVLKNFESAECLMPLDRVLVLEQPAHVLQIRKGKRRLQQAGCRAEGPAANVPKWEQKAVEQMLQVQAGSSQRGSFVRSKTLDLQALFGDSVSGLLEREKAVLHTALLANPEARFVDLSQNPGWANTGVIELPCITPHGKIFDTTARTFLTGRQKLQAQGFWPQSDASDETDSLEGDLAGNAFNFVSFLVALLSGLAAVSRVQL